MAECDWCNTKMSESVQVVARMSDRTKMICAVHKDCFKDITLPEFYNKIILRWEEELTNSKMSEEAKQDFREKYYNLKIVSIRRM